MRRPRPGPRRPVVAVALVTLAAALVADVAPAAGEAAGSYAPPVEAPVVDRFRLPDDSYAAGNRGIDYELPDGSEVRSSGSGEVTFAGPVGGELHVVVLHPDGLRTSYSFLREVLVRRGDRVGGGALIGRSGRSLHFGVRAGDRYVDPALLLAGAGVDVHLVPVEDRSPRPETTERRWLQAALAGARALGATGGAVASWLAGESATVAAAARQLSRPTALWRAIQGARAAYGQLLAGQRGCSPAGTEVPAGSGSRRIAVLVGGYGSIGGHADVLDVDTAALGYRDADRVQFSYAGGRVPGVGALDGVPVRGYDAATSMGDLERAGHRLRALLVAIQSAHPGVPVDVIAHSQGGVVARAALGGRGDALGVRNLITLGSPHRGAPLATATRDLELHDGDGVLDDGIRTASGGGVDPAAPAVVQLAEGSAFLEGLAARPAPPGVRVTSIAAAGDLVVPATASTLDGATNVVVPIGGPDGHGRLPGSAAVTDVVERALAGMGPPCTPPAVIAGHVATAVAIATVERGAGQAAGPVVRLADELARALTGAPR